MAQDWLEDLADWASQAVEDPALDERAILRLIDTRAMSSGSGQTAMPKQKTSGGGGGGSRMGYDELQVRDMVGEAGSAGFLLPVGPSPAQSKAITDSETAGRHLFTGSDLSTCSTCGQPVQDKVHRSGTRSGTRHPGPGHEPVPSGHIAGHSGRHVRAARARFDSNLAQVEPGLADALATHFQAQGRATVSRLRGKRGKQMLTRARQNDPPPPTQPDIPDDSLNAPGGSTAAPSIDPGAIFDAAFWADQLQSVLTPYLQASGVVATNEVKHSLSLPADDDNVYEGTALAGVKDALDQRAATSAVQVTGTTRDAIFDQLNQGVAAGEGIEELAKRIQSVFETASTSRAKMIAQTEAVGSLNQAAHTYAQALPDAVVGQKLWLAHHDDRVRPTHRAADGQAADVGMPFLVGGFPMQFPGDPAAPPGEVINCRCGVGYLPPSMKPPAELLEGLVPQDTLSALQAAGYGT